LNTAPIGKALLSIVALTVSVGISSLRFLFLLRRDLLPAVLPAFASSPLGSILGRGEIFLASLSLLSASRFLI
jgi:hypothetical protein